ncbi:hypothetical protein Moror_1737 [Moniliophthora roreri MCA 2997]|uniref:Uncharacterized protein n=1 Tax=Moniliophthora roreri (strain MCA 2997) TaxID=1381753 RepID=V2XKS5_MONRO|nr:hypothetical protein Moror_1737 [Moniliophthora roreri MCA 2997]
MGWTRNLHAYTFTDFRDGSLYGPENATSVDVTYAINVRYAVPVAIPTSD